MTHYSAEFSDGLVVPIESATDEWAIAHAIRGYVRPGRTLCRVHSGNPLTPSIRVVWRADEAPDDLTEFELGRQQARRVFDVHGGVVSIDAWESMYWLYVRRASGHRRSRDLGYVHEARRMWLEAHGDNTEN